MQTPPAWDGSFSINNLNDTLRLAEFSEITGDLYIRDGNFPLDRSTTSLSNSLSIGFPSLQKRIVIARGLDLLTK